MERMWRKQHGKVQDHQRSKIKNPFVVKIRELLEHRAFWLYLLVDEAEKRGLDPKDFASAAITRCGVSQGTELQKRAAPRA